MEIRASFDAATLNLTANVAKSDGESTRGGGYSSIGAGVSFYNGRMQFIIIATLHLISLFEVFKELRKLQIYQESKHNKTYLISEEQC